MAKDRIRDTSAAISAVLRDVPDERFQVQVNALVCPSGSPHCPRVQRSQLLGMMESIASGAAVVDDAGISTAAGDE